MRGLTVKGDFTAAEDVTVDFELEGLVDLAGHRLVVAEGGIVRAAVTAAGVLVHGRLTGHLSAERVELASTAVVEGTIVTPKLRVHDGAQFIGPVNTERAHAAASVARHRHKTPAG